MQWKGETLLPTTAKAGQRQSAPPRLCSRLRPGMPKSKTAQLKEYEAKRQFQQTPEPEPEVEAGRKGPLLFVIQKHSATRLHYDLRLELDGVLKSWAVPKGPSYTIGEKHMAV